MLEIVYIYIYIYKSPSFIFAPLVPIVRSFYLPSANCRLPSSMSKTSAMKSSKTLETPKAKAQGEVDYKAKIDVVIEAFSSKVTRGPAPLCTAVPAPCLEP